MSRPLLKSFAREIMIMRMYEYPKKGDLEEIKIELTKDCPLSCIHCSSNASSGNPLQLTREVVLSLLSQASELEVKSIVLSGGEPLIWPWITDAVRACSELGLRSSIYSTGINLTDDGAKEIMTLANSGLSRVIFSLYSPFKPQHEGITRKSGSFDKTVQVMKELGESDIEREIHFVPLKINYKNLDKLIELAKNSGISKVSILRFVPQGRGVILKKSREMLTRKETVELRKLISDCKKRYDVNIRLGSPYNILILNEEVDCIAARKTLCIGPNGNVYPCDAFKNTEPSEIGLNDPFHNILKHSLNECWTQSVYLNTIRRYLTTPFEDPCSHCVYLKQCKSGCLAQKVIEQESIEDGNIVKRADPLCLKNLVGG
ncbi:radical SAM protein [Chloroflexota bacterium]